MNKHNICALASVSLANVDQYLKTYMKLVLSSFGKKRDVFKCIVTLCESDLKLDLDFYVSNANKLIQLFCYGILLPTFHHFVQTEIWEIRIFKFAETFFQLFRTNLGKHDKQKKHCSIFICYKKQTNKLAVRSSLGDLQHVTLSPPCLWSLTQKSHWDFYTSRSLKVHTVCVEKYFLQINLLWQTIHQICIYWMSTSQIPTEYDTVNHVLTNKILHNIILDWKLTIIMLVVWNLLN